MNYFSRWTPVARFMIRRRINQPIHECPNHVPILEDSIEHAMLFPLCGVHVLCGSGCSILNVARRLQKEERIAGILLATCKSRNENPFSWLKGVFQISDEEKSRFMSDLLDKSGGVVLVLDQFHLSMHESFLVSLAEDSVMTKKYTVIACVENQFAFEKILGWNGRSKICGIY